jgi:hypothetical protein
MRRPSRRSRSDFLPTEALPHVLRAISFLIVLALIYTWVRKPQNWHWLEKATEPPSGTVAAVNSAANKDKPAKSATAPEVVVPGPTDRDNAEAADGRRLLEAVSDRAPLDKVEMPAYWRLMKWARAQSFADLERRAADHVFITRFLEEPDACRGKLFRLRLHIQQIVDWDAPQNPSGVTRVFEARGATDESKSFPYVVVFSELPEGMKLGDQVEEEAVFVGYFMKTLAFTAVKGRISAPLLVGRMRRIGTVDPTLPVVARRDGNWIWIGVLGVALLFSLSATWLRMRGRYRAKIPSAVPADDAQMEDWFRSGAADRPPNDRGDVSPNVDGP